jgi:hypothetical protein
MVQIDHPVRAGAETRAVGASDGAGVMPAHAEISAPAGRRVDGPPFDPIAGLASVSAA